MALRTAELTTSKGDTWATSINGTDAEICQYFLGAWVDRGIYEEEDMQQVIKCVIDGKPYDLEIGGRILKTETCSGTCGKTIQQWVPKSGGKCKCSDCRDAESRQQHGWTPANSID